MKFWLKVKFYGLIEDLESRKDLILVNEYHDVESIKEYFGNDPKLEDFGGFFIGIEEGEYAEVYGFEGNIPYLNKDVYKITWGWE